MRNYKMPSPWLHVLAVSSLLIVQSVICDSFCLDFEGKFCASSEDFSFLGALQSQSREQAAAAVTEWMAQKQLNYSAISSFYDEKSVRFFNRWVLSAFWSKNRKDKD